MILYTIGTVLERSEKEKGNYVAVLDSYEAVKKKYHLPHSAPWKDYLSHLRYCKVEAGKEHITGTFSVPGRKKERRNFCFLMDQQRLVFIDDSGKAKELLAEEAARQRWDIPSTGQVLCDFLGLLIEKDAKNLMEMEAFVEQLAHEVMAQKMVENFTEKFFKFSSRLTVWEHYYDQLMDLGEELEENPLHLLDDECMRKLHIFTARTERLMHNVQMLREYMFQVQNMYQAQISFRQNKIMQTLTIVTTIFLPLSLLVGWYGMNFRSMPELNWRYSYPVVILVSLVIVLGCIWYFKKKKFW